MHTRVSSESPNGVLITLRPYMPLEPKYPHRPSNRRAALVAARSVLLGRSIHGLHPLDVLLVAREHGLLDRCRVGQRVRVHPSPYTIRRTPYALRPMPNTLHPTGCGLGGCQHSTSSVGQPCGAQRVTGVPRLQETAPPYDPTVGLCLGSKGSPRGVSVFLCARYTCRVHAAGSRVRGCEGVAKACAGSARASVEAS